jgi:hypothetical protein
MDKTARDDTANARRLQGWRGEQRFAADHADGRGSTRTSRAGLHCCRDPLPSALIRVIRGK